MEIELEMEILVLKQGTGFESKTMQVKAQRTLTYDIVGVMWIIEYHHSRPPLPTVICV